MLATLSMLVAESCYMDGAPLGGSPAVVERQGTPLDQFGAGAADSYYQVLAQIGMLEAKPETGLGGWYLYVVAPLFLESRSLEGPNGPEISLAWPGPVDGMRSIRCGHPSFGGAPPPDTCWNPLLEKMIGLVAGLQSKCETCVFLEEGPARDGWTGRLYPVTQVRSQSDDSQAGSRWVTFPSYEDLFFQVVGYVRPADDANRDVQELEVYHRWLRPPPEKTSGEAWAAWRDVLLGMEALLGNPSPEDPRWEAKVLVGFRGVIARRVAHALEHIPPVEEGVEEGSAEG